TALIFQSRFPLCSPVCCLPGFRSALPDRLRFLSRPKNTCALNDPRLSLTTIPAYSLFCTLKAALTRSEHRGPGQSDAEDIHDSQQVPTVTRPIAGYGPQLGKDIRDTVPSQSPLLPGHSLRKQSRVSSHSPRHSEPPYEGPLHSRVRCMVPLEQEVEHELQSDHSLQTPSTGAQHRRGPRQTEAGCRCGCGPGIHVRKWMSTGSMEDDTQKRVRLCQPSPHVAEHTLHGDHSSAAESTARGIFQKLGVMNDKVPQRRFGCESGSRHRNHCCTHPSGPSCSSHLRYTQKSNSSEQQGRSLHLHRFTPKSTLARSPVMADTFSSSENLNGKVEDCFEGEDGR
ncbi:hypothetical protein Z043_104970, partial [Scleropages formosus]